AHLFESTRTTVHLAALHRDEVVYLNKLHGPRPIPSPSRVGGGLPAYCTGVGKAMLAFDEGAAARVAEGPLPAWTETTLTSAAALSASAPDEGTLARLEPLVLRVAAAAGRALAEDR